MLLCLLHPPQCSTSLTAKWSCCLTRWVVSGFVGSWYPPLSDRMCAYTTLSSMTVSTSHNPCSLSWRDSELSSAAARFEPWLHSTTIGGCMTVMPCSTFACSNFKFMCESLVCLRTFVFNVCVTLLAGASNRCLNSFCVNDAQVFTEELFAGDARPHWFRKQSSSSLSQAVRAEPSAPPFQTVIVLVLTILRRDLLICIRRDSSSGHSYPY